MVQKRKMETLIKKDVDTAKICVGEKRKQMALLALRKKKQHEQMLHTCMEHINKLEELVGHVETAVVGGFAP